MDFYEIVFSGDLVSDVSHEQVKANLARLFQASEEQVERLLSGRRLVLKDNLDAVSAEKYRVALERAGVMVRVEAMSPGVETIELSAPAPARRAHVEPRDLYMAAFSEVDAPDYAIAEVGVELQPPKPAVAAPRLDLSQMSMAPVGSDLGQLSETLHVLVPDVSHLKLTP